jgi:hypothetical protein
MRIARLFRLFPVLLVLSHAAAAQAQTADPDLRSDIQHLLDVTGANQVGAQLASIVSGQVLDGMKRAQPSVPQRALDIAKEVLDQEFARAFSGPDSLNEQMIDVYARHFTRAEIQGLVAFYSTDLGKKAITVLPAIVQESSAIGQRWAQRQMPRITAAVQTRLRAEGFIK